MLNLGKGAGGSSCPPLLANLCKLPALRPTSISPSQTNVGRSSQITSFNAGQGSLIGCPTSVSLSHVIHGPSRQTLPSRVHWFPSRLPTAPSDCDHLFEAALCSDQPICCVGNQNEMGKNILSPFCQLANTAPKFLPHCKVSRQPQSTPTGRVE